MSDGLTVTELLPDATISTRQLTRIIVVLIAAWSLLAGIVLVFFPGATSGALGAGVTDEAGQRLVGAHLLVLSPVYALVAWRFHRYRQLLWLPFAAQAAVFFSVGYGILSGETDFGDGILAVAVSGIFVALLGFVWVHEQRALARARLEARESEVAWADEQAADEQGAHGPY